MYTSKHFCDGVRGGVIQRSICSLFRHVKCNACLSRRTVATGTANFREHAHEEPSRFEGFFTDFTQLVQKCRSGAARNLDRAKGSCSELVSVSLFFELASDLPSSVVASLAHSFRQSFLTVILFLSCADLFAGHLDLSADKPGKRIGPGISRRVVERPTPVPICECIDVPFYAMSVLFSHKARDHVAVAFSRKARRLSRAHELFGQRMGSAAV